MMQPWHERAHIPRQELTLLDANIFCGHFPFRKLKCETPADLGNFLHKAQIERCIATPFESIFYRQPWEGLAPWLASNELPEAAVQFWLAINPMMPGWQADAERAAADDRIAGLRLFPRYHGYGLDHGALQQLIDAAAALGLPVNLTARLLDDRLHPYPLRADVPLEMNSVSQLLTTSAKCRWVLSMFTMAELKLCSDAVAQHGFTWIDIGCSKPFEFWEDDIRAAARLDRIIYGTGAPLYYHAGGRISLARSGLTRTEKQAITCENLETMLAARGIGTGIADG